MHVEEVFPVKPAQLRETLVDPAFLAELGEKFGGVGTAAVESSESTITVATRRQLPMQYVPGAAKPFVGDGIVAQTDLWSLESDDPVDGSWSATIDGAPAKLGGGYTIVTTDSGCRYTVTAQVKVNIPLIGGRVESEIRRYLTSLVSKQMEFTLTWLVKQ